MANYELGVLRSKLRRGETQAADGSINLRARTASTAAALETLAASYSKLTAYAGDTHTWETAPYLPTVNFDLNGGELRNTNTTALNVNDKVSATLPLGTSTYLGLQHADLDYYTIASTSGATLTLGAGEGSNFAEGDLVFVHGASSYTSGSYTPWAFARIAEVRSSTSDTVTLDQVLDAELLADTPVIACIDGTTPSGITGIDFLYFVKDVNLRNGKLSSATGETIKWGGAYRGAAENLHVEGRNGWALNNMHRVRIRNVTFDSWRKAGEIAEHSYDTVIEDLHGTLGDASTKSGGGSDVANFMLAIHENSRECGYERPNVSGGPNDFGVDKNAVQLGSGRRNFIRGGFVTAPAHTGFGVSIQSNVGAGGRNVDSLIEGTRFDFPNCLTFFKIQPASGGDMPIRPVFRNVKFFGAVSSGVAGYINANGGELIDVWCEDGAFSFNNASTTTNLTMTGCYAPDGFANLTPAILAANDIRDNDSDANRLLRAAAVWSVANQNITTTTSDTVWEDAVFPAGTLTPYDQVSIETQANTYASGTTNRNARVSVVINGESINIGSAIIATVSSSLDVQCRMDVLTDTAITYRTYIGGVLRAVGNIDLEHEDIEAAFSTHSLTVQVKYWVADAGEPINAKSCRIWATKPGMVKPF